MSFWKPTKTKKKKGPAVSRKPSNSFVLVGGAKGDRTPDLMTAS